MSFTVCSRDDMTRGIARPSLAGRRLVDYGAERLRRLCVAAGYGADTDAAVATFRRLVSPWGERVIGQTSSWLSDVSDDNTPIELSVVLGQGRPEVRVLFEPQPESPTLAGQRAAGRAAMDRLARELGADLTRFARIEDLFLPEDMNGPFALWNAAVLAPGRAPELKVYLNPAVRGPGRAAALVEEALARLGFSRAWAALGEVSAGRGPHLDEIKYFSLDLSAGPHARVKVYIHHHEATPDDLEAACSLSRTYVAGEVREFARAMCGDRERLSARSPFTCAAFVSGAADRPAAVTAYVPVCAYARDDGEIRERMNRYLGSRGIDASRYDAILDGFADRDLADGVGMQSWIALRRSRSGASFTVYLATEARRVHPPGSIPAATAGRLAFASAESILEALRHDLADHPFLRSLAREPRDAGALWLLIANAYEGTSKHFVRWLAWVTARVDDDRIRCLLAHQLDEELGEGDHARAHGILMQGFLRAIERLKPEDVCDADLTPGRRLGAELATHYLSDDAHEGLGALMAGEICAQQLIGAVARLLAAHGVASDEPALAWLRRHDELEGDHAEESFVLARMIPRERQAIDAIRRGALGTHAALHRFLDAMYAARARSAAR